MSEARERNKAIATIEALFPADAEYPRTAVVGCRLLEQAKKELAGWRTLPTPVLIRYAQLCEDEENHLQRTAVEKHTYHK